jgi:tRNA modification GTPase
VDLLQAEAVADLVAAAGETAQRTALYQLQGKLSEYLAELRRELLDISALFAAYTDFPEEDIPQTEKRDLIDRLDSARERLGRLVASYRRGKLIREGMQVAIIGPVNAGKSSLFNAILAEERAIVTEIPGTTRDSISESIELSGLPVRFSDTAGLRETGDLIEAKGIEHSERQISAAIILLLVLDITELTSGDSGEAEKLLRETLERFHDREIMLVFNKIDLVKQDNIDSLQDKYEQYEPEFISAKDLTGVDELLSRIAEWINDEIADTGDPNVLTNERHYRAAAKAADILAEVRQRLTQDLSYEFLAFDLRQAVELLEELLGKITNEEVLEEIFGRFCIGK